MQKRDLIPAVRAVYMEERTSKKGNNYWVYVVQLKNGLKLDNLLDFGYVDAVQELLDQPQK
jgi:hypothetical protein